MTQLNLELELLEPWLTSGGTPQLVSFHVDAPRGTKVLNSQKNPAPPTKAAGSSKTAGAKPPPKKSGTSLQAALIRSDDVAILLPMWLEENGQFVPGPTAAANVSFVVPGRG